MPNFSKEDIKGFESLVDECFADSPEVKKEFKQFFKQYLNKGHESQPKTRLRKLLNFKISRHLAKTMRIMAFSTATIYLLMSFAAWDFNPGDWTPEHRNFTTVLAAFAALFFALLHIVEAD